MRQLSTNRPLGCGNEEIIGIFLTKAKVWDRFLNVLFFCYINSTSYYMISEVGTDVCTIYNIMWRNLFIISD